MPDERTAAQKHYGPAGKRTAASPIRVANGYAATEHFFTPAPGDPADACPNCGIHRQYAGNPEACGEGYCKPGCFSEESYAKDGFPL